MPVGGNVALQGLERIPLLLQSCPHSLQERNAVVCASLTNITYTGVSCGVRQGQNRGCVDGWVRVGVWVGMGISVQRCIVHVLCVQHANPKT